MHASQWPFPTRPATNNLIQVLIAMALGAVLVFFPVSTAAVSAALILFFGGRSIIREIRAEWHTCGPDCIEPREADSKECGTCHAPLDADGQCPNN